MRIRFSLALVFSFCFLLFLQVQAQPTTTMKPETIEAFDGFVGPLERDFVQSIEKGAPQLWMENNQTRATARSGRIQIRKIDDVPKIPGGIIHLWKGLVFVPNAKVEVALALLTDYDRHKAIYPEVVDSKLLGRDKDIARGFLRLKKVKVLTVVLNTEHEARTFQGGDGRSYVFSHSTRIAEVRNVGEEDEKELPIGEDSGFVWRLNAYWALEQVEDGVLLECASISLSREIPWGLGWMIRPFVESTPREALEEMLQATRVELHE